MLVSASYPVPVERQAAFVAAMQRVGRSRQRTGSWQEHLGQHEDRLTGTDGQLDEQAQALAVGPPRVTHLLPADRGVDRI